MLIAFTIIIMIMLHKPISMIVSPHYFIFLNAGSVSHSPSWASPPIVSSTHHRRTKRRPYSKLQIVELEKQYQDNMYLTRDRRTRLSEALNLSERQVSQRFIGLYYPKCYYAARRKGVLCGRKCFQELPAVYFIHNN